MAYEFRYSLGSAPEASVDGSGMAIHDIQAEYRENGGDWTVMGARHKSFCVPAADLAVVLAMPHGTAPEKAAKNVAYKELLAQNIDTQFVPIAGWSAAQLAAFLDANAAAAEQAAAADAYITVTLGLSYPVPFNL